MPSGKRRLYVALCARGGRKPGGSDTATYHWALLVGPKIEQDRSRVLLYHAKERLDTTTGSLVWIYEGVEPSLLPSSVILVRVMVAKILEPDTVEPTLAAVRLVQKDPSWNCVSWVEDALGALERSGCLGTRRIDWQEARQAAMDYVTRKVKEHRFDGTTSVDTTKVATYSLLDRKETIL